MKFIVTSALLATLLVPSVFSAKASAAEVIIRPLVRQLIVEPGFLIFRPLPREVVVRPMPRVEVSEPVKQISYQPPVVWTTQVASLQPTTPILLQGDTVLYKNEDWVDSKLPVNNQGNSLVLQVQGRPQINFAEVKFRDGQVQIVDFGQTLNSGMYQLLNFGSRRNVVSVRILARSQSNQTNFNVYMT